MLENYFSILVFMAVGAFMGIAAQLIGYLLGEKG